MIERRRVRIALAAALTGWTAWAGATEEKVRLLKQDTSSLPVVRLYLEAPGPSWVSATGRIELAEKAPERLGVALASQRARYEEARAAAAQPSEVEAKPPPADPVHSPAVQLLGAKSQVDPAEGLLVVFLVDAGGSMRRGDRMANARRYVQAVLGRLGSHDRVGLYTFAKTVRARVEPTTEHARVTTAMGESRSFADGARTLVYDAVCETLEQVFGRETQPTLPHRRFLVLLSAGEDARSKARVEDVRALLDRAPSPPVLVTVGVGSAGERPRRFVDLERLATFGGDVANCLTMPPPQVLAKHFEQLRQQLHTQLLVEFTLDPYYWRQGDHSAVLHLELGGTETIDLPVALRLPSLEQDRLAAHEARTEAIDAVLEEYDATRRLRQVLLYGVAGLVLLAVLVLVIVQVRRAARVRAELQQAEREDASASLGPRLDQPQVGTDAGQAVADAARPPLASLFATDGPLEGRSFEVLQPVCTVGREGCQTPLPNEDGDLTISRTHAEFRLDGGHWVVTCLSRSGMEVGERRLRAQAESPVQYGDVVRMGKTSFRFDPP